jgi:predicted branched-subunit amino acid permease
MFFLGLALTSVSLWLFLDSVRVSTDHHGWISGMLMGRGPGAGVQTTSLGIIFVPFFCGVFALFYNARQKWAWWLTGIGIAIVALEILSRLQFFMSMKTSHLLLMIAAFAAGTSIMFHSYRQLPNEPKA